MLLRRPRMWHLMLHFLLMAVMGSYCLNYHLSSHSVFYWQMHSVFGVLFYSVGCLIRVTGDWADTADTGYQGDVSKVRVTTSRWEGDNRHILQVFQKLGTFERAHLKEQSILSNSSSSLQWSSMCGMTICLGNTSDNEPKHDRFAAVRDSKKLGLPKLCQQVVETKTTHCYTQNYKIHRG
jgi:hypothetical protein